MKCPAVRFKPGDIATHKRPAQRRTNRNEDVRLCQFGFGFGEGNPEAAPGRVAMLGGPDAAHFARGVAGDEGVFVEIVRHMGLVS